ncbi:hypothetical protein AK88_05442 [Plasmodium fragile]|uniref:Schizont-infected cell agglutination C-terminal domain-containing protein n=1 Tax=Plasmodium fragile TaxID=5857 RepID=A0A0D9QDK5_PLAFR|nr:uncharacterized protein AK88_05442 [Plasmodium fragile]KJP84922.1 hypothetical protein AK88_05442 [Plasmodium fragile]
MTGDDLIGHHQPHLPNQHQPRTPSPAGPEPPKTAATTPVTAPEATSPGKATCPGSNGTSTGVSISCATTSDEALGETEKVKKLLQQADKNKADQSEPRGGPTSGEASTAGTEHGAGGGPGAPGGGGGGSGSSSSSGPGSTGDQNPTSTTPGSSDPVNPGSSGTSSTGHTNKENVEAKGTHEDKLPADAPINPSVPPGLTWEHVKWYIPAIIPAVVGIGVLAFFLWKYFAYLAKRRRTYRTVRDVPSPPLDEDILQHLQRGEPPPPDYGYTMIRDRHPASTSERRGPRPPRVHTRTIIELHLEVLNECEATEWENVKDDFYGILVEEFMGGNNGHSSSLDAPTTNQALSRNNVSTILDPSTDSAQTDPCRPHDPDPWSCMENIDLDAEQNAHSDHGDATSDHTNWINWIDRNKHLLQDCTTQPWFNALKSEWKQYYQQYAPNEASGVNRTAATMESRKFDAWKEWVAKQHALMNTYSEEPWFQHLWSNIAQTGVVTEEDGMPEQIRTVQGVSHIHTVDEKPTTFVTDQGPPVEKGLKVEEALEGGSALKVRHLPQQQLHPQPYMKQPLTAQTWILILALVIEQCELESSMQEKELYVDDLLQQLCN